MTSSGFRKIMACTLPGSTFHQHLRIGSHPLLVLIRLDGGLEQEPAPKEAAEYSVEAS